VVVDGGLQPQQEPPGERAALERFAGAWMQWSEAASPDGQRELLSLSTGPLRQRLTLETKRIAADGSAPAAGSVSATIEGVLLRDPQPALVITSETTHFEAGGDQTTYAIYLAQATRSRGGWRITQWSPVQ
jgi:hypothetical protein